MSSGLEEGGEVGEASLRAQEHPQASGGGGDAAMLSRERGSSRAKNVRDHKKEKRERKKTMAGLRRPGKSPATRMGCGGGCAREWVRVRVYKTCIDIFI